MNATITMIIPLRLTARTHEGALRLERLCATVPRDCFDILISDYGTQPEHDEPIRRMEADGVRVVRHPSPRRLFSIGQARDFGVAQARTPVVLFNDIDFLGTADMYRRIHEEVMRRDIARNMFDFFCVPVLFLTETGTQKWFAAADAGVTLPAELSTAAVEAATGDIQSAAYGSSAMIINRHHYMAVGGHDPKFVGHGAEDYDLLHRLSTLAPRGPRPNGYFSDFGDNSVRKYWGFRAFFALYGLDVFLRGIHLVHLWHPRRQEKGYFRSRQNFRNLKKVMVRFERKSTMPQPLADAGADSHWLVLLRTSSDMMLARQLLPLSRAYTLRRLRSLPEPQKIAIAAGWQSADTLLVMPDVDGNVAALDADPDVAGMRVLSIRPGSKADHYLIRDRKPGLPAIEQQAEAVSITGTRGNIVYRYWKQISLAPAAPLESGRIPPMEKLNAPIFKSFGGETLLDRKLHVKPGRKKKSSVWTRIRRALSGY